MKYWNILVERFGIQTLMIAGAVLLAFVIAMILLRTVNLKKYKKEIITLENRMNAIKSLPIQYKLGRVKGIVKNMPELEEKYDAYMAGFEKIAQLQIEEIVPLINDIDEALYYNKLRGVKKNMRRLNECLDTYERESKDLLKQIEEVSEIENIQRIEIIKVKELFRDVKDQYAQVRFKVEDYVPDIALIIDEIEATFVELEKYMNAQEFEEAAQMTASIKERITYCQSIIERIPDLIAHARQYLPQRIEDIQQSIDSMKARDFAIERINTTARMEKINNDYQAIVDCIKKLDIDDVPSMIEVISEELSLLSNDFEKEEHAYALYEEKRTKCFKNADKLDQGLLKIKETFNKIKEQYILDEYDVTIHEDYQNYQKVLDEIAILNEVIESKDFSYNQMIEDFENIEDKCKPFNDTLIKHESLAQSLYIEEKRALDELDNINIVLLEIKSEIRNKHLPMISESYKDYIEDSYVKANAILSFIKRRPIDLRMLSLQVDAARDVIYKLYDNVHNLIVTAEMVEDAIVFGNRYRSTYLEVNTELTKAELLYRNGEYTKALSTAVDIIEKVRPNSYEMLIRNKSPQ